MLAADRSLLEVNLRQSAIKLREKELNLYADNLAAMATQAAVLAGFTTTCLIEIPTPENPNTFSFHLLHISAIVSICANITCVSLCTITSMFGSGKALRGRDGSMDEAVEGMNIERNLIIKCFYIGLSGNLITVLSTCLILMAYPVNIIAFCIVLFSMYVIYTNSVRIYKKFQLTETVKLDDLTQYPVKVTNSINSISRSHSAVYTSEDDNTSIHNNLTTNGSRYRRTVSEAV